VHEDHAPSSGDHFNHKKLWLNQRAAASKAGGRVSNCRRLKWIDLASKNGEKLNLTKSMPLATLVAVASPLEPLRSAFLSTNKEETKNKTKQKQKHKLP
jgi:hypothetical protein